MTDGTDAYGEACFRIVTEAGESMSLTQEMVAALADHALLLGGDCVAGLEVADAQPGEHRPAQALSLVLAPGYGLEQADRPTVAATVRPANLSATRWPFTARGRPAGWPR